MGGFSGVFAFNNPKVGTAAQIFNASGAKLAETSASGCKGCKTSKKPSSFSHLRVASRS
jgi:hypothetical protein